MTFCATETIVSIAFDIDACDAMRIFKWMKFLNRSCDCVLLRQQIEREREGSKGEKKKTESKRNYSHCNYFRYLISSFCVSWNRPTERKITTFSTSFQSFGRPLATAVVIVWSHCRVASIDDYQLSSESHASIDVVSEVNRRSKKPKKNSVMI